MYSISCIYSNVLSLFYSRKSIYILHSATVTVHQFFCILHFCYTCSLCRVELEVQFPARGSTQVLLCLLWLWHFLYSVGPHPVSNLHIYPLLCRGHSLRVRLAKQETLTPPGHLVSPLVFRGPWMSQMEALDQIFFQSRLWHELCVHMDIINSAHFQK